MKKILLIATGGTNEAMVKQTAMEQCKNCYVLCDNSKFDIISSVTFAPFYGTVFITDKYSVGYEEYENILVVE